MKKILITSIAAMCLFGVTACGGSDDDDPVETDAGPVIPDGGPAIPDGGPVIPDGGPAIPDGGPESDAAVVDPCAACAEDEICKDGKECVESDYGEDCDESFVERCDGNVAVYCSSRGVTPLYCDNNWGVGASECGYIENWGVDCLLPCDADDVEDGINLCVDYGEDGAIAYSALECAPRTDKEGYGAYYGESTDETECTSGVCAADGLTCQKAHPEEGDQCTPGEYVEKCVDNMVIWCASDESVHVDICGDDTCLVSEGHEGAFCFGSDYLCDPDASGEAQTMELCSYDTDEEENYYTYVQGYFCGTTDVAGTGVWVADEESVDICDSSESCYLSDSPACTSVDDRLGTECSASETVCSSTGHAILTCEIAAGSAAGTWVVAQDCLDYVCKTPAAEDGEIGCFENDPCTASDSEKKECSYFSFLGMGLYSIDAYVCTEMTDGSYLWVMGDYELCETTCQEGSTVCD